MLITYVNSLDPDQARQVYSNVNAKKKHLQMTKEHTELPRKQRVPIPVLYEAMIYGCQLQYSLTFIKEALFPVLRGMLKTCLAGSCDYSSELPHKAIQNKYTQDTFDAR